MAAVKIDRTSVNGIQAPYSVRPGAPPAAPAAPSPQADQLTLSEKVSRAADVKAQLAARPEVRARLIAEIKQQIASGSYKVDARRLADRLLKAGVLDE